MKERLDRYLVSKGIFESRTRAQASIMEGLVRVNGSNRVKPGTPITGDEKIEVIPRPRKYVSRGGEKLDAALERFQVEVEDLDALDVGASTGGFTDCLLQKGARRVISLDVGYGQLDYNLREDPRVTVLERFNARYLEKGHLPFEPSIATVDVSFISLKKIILPVIDTLSERGLTLALVKPQFEAGPSKVGKGGVIRDSGVLVDVARDIIGWLRSEMIPPKQFMVSPLEGAKGNKEFMLLISKASPGKDKTAGVDLEDVEREINESTRT